MFDRDGDGKISALEFRAVMSSLVEKLSDSDFDRMVREVDLDRDGSISFEEFSKMLLPANKRSLVCGVQIGDKVQGETRRMRYAGLKDLEGPLVSDYKGMSNLKEIFESNVRASPTKQFLGTRVKDGEYTWKSFQEIYELSKSFANWLYQNDMCQEVTSDEGTMRFLGIFSKNREEWAITDFASIISGITTVPLYDTLGQDAIEYILDQT